MFDSLSQREVIKEKRNSIFERKQWKEKHTLFANKNEKFSKVEVLTYHGFYRFIFDPGGYQATNSRSISLEEGENDVILKFYPLTRRNISVLEKKESKLKIIIQACDNGK
ncbi:unnamed protein product [Trifolium pratense]|uniref:Uncharacterized protein n=1 Tax=Trifolium pratense TaxID=57577 RepID=A0ACB0K6I6_TRIPR|nr:unnamed protein product [Trifolium pratense]